MMDHPEGVTVGDAPDGETEKRFPRKHMGAHIALCVLCYYRLSEQADSMTHEYSNENLLSSKLLELLQNYL